mmetsp:Transcript_52504/g.58679  ORF Transcript_52504/g.58679 Transcript_52504/m.58679 type:complete len:149 (-) Transcript_52504:32-478(-)
MKLSILVLVTSLVFSDLAIAQFVPIGPLGPIGYTCAQQCAFELQTFNLGIGCVDCLTASIPIAPTCVQQCKGVSNKKNCQRKCIKSECTLACLTSSSKSCTKACKTNVIVCGKIDGDECNNKNVCSWNGEKCIASILAVDGGGGEDDG